MLPTVADANTLWQLPIPLTQHPTCWFGCSVVFGASNPVAYLHDRREMTHHMMPIGRRAAYFKNS